MPSGRSYGMREQVQAGARLRQHALPEHPEWPVIDVTGRAIEETAVIILESLKERDERARAARTSLL